MLKSKPRIGKLLDKYGGQVEDEQLYPGVPVSLPNPVSWIKRNAEDSRIPGIHWAFVHGDLHGDNLFTNGEYAWAIDLARSGPGHILHDFIALEVDIATRLANFAEKDFSRFFEFAIVLTQHERPVQPLRLPSHLHRDAEVNKATSVIMKLRDWALELTDYRDLHEYLWGLLFRSLHVALLDSAQPSQRKRALLLGSVLCASLQSWDAEWPPQDWPTVNPGSVILPPGASVPEQVELTRLINMRFGASELRSLYFELKVDYDDLPGERKEDKVRELVTYMDRRGRLSELEETVRRLRPDVSWPGVS
jgi:hypothetical protein